MGGEVRIGIVGIGNCASALVQGIHYYAKKKDDLCGLMHYDICGYKPQDINVVAAFDIDKRKVGKPLHEAIFALPNCTKVIKKDVPHSDVIVSAGPVLDGVSPHMKNYPEARTFVVSDIKPVDVVEVLKEKKVDYVTSCIVWKKNNLLRDVHYSDDEMAVTK